MCRQPEETHFQELVEGSLDWAAVELVFKADVVEIEDAGNPPLFRSGQLEGYTRRKFEEGSTIYVTVKKKGEVTALVVCRIVCLWPLQMSTHARRVSGAVSSLC